MNFSQVSELIAREKGPNERSSDLLDLGSITSSPSASSSESTDVPRAKQSPSPLVWSIARASTTLGRSTQSNEMDAIFAKARDTAAVLSEHVNGQIDGLANIMKSLFVGTVVSETRQSLKRSAEEDFERLHESRIKRPSVLEWDYWKPIFSIPSIPTETQEQKERRFKEFNEIKSHELDTDDEWKRSAERSSAKGDLDVIELLIDDEASTQESSTNPAIIEMKKASLQRIDRIKKITAAGTKSHIEYVGTLSSEGRKELPVVADGGAGKGTGEFSFLVRRKPISKIELSLLDDSFGGFACDDDLVVERFGSDLTKRCFRTLREGTWIIDEIVNSYLEMCCAQGGNRVDRPYLFTSFFLTRLIMPNKGYDYREVQKWTARGAGKADLFCRRAVIWPINLNNTHWVLAVADMKFKQITYYDSMGGSGEDKLQVLFQYLKDEHQAKKNSPLPDSDKWTLMSHGRKIPQQSNCNDCGVFACTFAHFLMEYYLKHDDKPAPASIFAFNAKDMILIRQQMQLDLLRGILFPSE